MKRSRVLAGALGLQLVGSLPLPLRGQAAPGFGAPAGVPMPQQQPPPPQTRPAPVPQQPAQAAPAQQPAANQQAPAQPAANQQAPAQQPAPPQATPPAQMPSTATAVPTPATPPATTLSFGGLNLQNASLTEVIDMLARSLKINYILDPRVRGGVNLNTYGDPKSIDQRSLLDIILRINGFTMVQVGEIYRIVPLGDVSHQPLTPQVDRDRKAIPENDQTQLNLIFLRYASADELAKVLDPFLGEGAKMYVYTPANLLFVLDSNRSMRRTMELISLFDNDTLANQRVRAFEVQNGRPTDLAKELETVFKSISLSEKSTPIRFLPIDRINTVIAVVTNPTAFGQVEEWIKKLDVPIKITAGAVDNYVYRVKYSRAETLATAIMQLYGGYGGYGGGYSPFAGGSPGYSGAGYPGGGYPGGGYPGAYPGGGYPGGGYPGAYPGGAYPTPYVPPAATTGAAPGATTAAGGTTAGAAAGVDQTGQYMMGGMGYGGMMGMPRIIPRIDDNSILIQANPQQYASIQKLLVELDVPPRQVLIDAKIYEVSMTGAFASGVQAYLQSRGAKDGLSLNTRQLAGALTSGGVGLSAGLLVGRSRELLGTLSLNESTNRAKVISSPSIIATDSIGASINVGQEVPTLTAQAVTGVQSGGNSLFANSIQNRSTGVTLNIKARVTPAGIVTLEVNQEVSSPIPTTSSGISSPSFSKRSVSTQVTLQDGDTIAIGGIISESNTSAVNGIPVLTRIPYVGGVFGTKSLGRERTELVIFLTPRVIYDTTDVVEASDELKSRLRKISKILKD